MTEKTLRTLLRKKRLTSNERVRVMRTAHQLLSRSIHCFSAVQDACDTAADEITGNCRDRFHSTKDEHHVDRLEEIRDELETLVETLDNLEIPDLNEVR